MTLPAPFAPVAFSTNDLPERDRVGVLCDVVGRQLLRVEHEVLPGGPFYTHLAMRQLPGLRMFTGAGCGTRLRRTRELIADGQDEIAIYANKSGLNSINQRGRDAAVGEGDACIYSSTETCTFTNPTPIQTFGISVPRNTLAPLVNNIGDTFGRLIPRGDEALKLLRGYIGLLEDDAAVQDIENMHDVVINIHDLLALAIGATRDAAESARGRGVRAARLRAIKKDVEVNLMQGALSIDSIARRHRLSPRYIQILFQSDSTTFSDFAVNQRLHFIHRALTKPHSKDKISAIVFESGFGDLSYFNHRFRRLYGATPSDVRAEARHAFEG